MNDLILTKRKIAVIGFGISGKSITKFFLSQNISVDIFEDKEKENFSQDDISYFVQNPLCSIFFASDVSEVSIDQYDYIIASPGVWTTHTLIKSAIESNIEYVTDVTIFIRVFRKKYPHGKIISITGSNGKSTTVSMLYDALKAAQCDVYLGGNIGTSPLDFFEEIKTDQPIIILETSSYQLEYLKQNDYFDIAGITNISDNHLNRYAGSKELYAHAKCNGIHPEYTDVLINADDIDTQKYIVPALKTKHVLPIAFEHVLYKKYITLENDSLMYINNDSKEMILPDIKKMKIQGLHNIYNCAFVCGVLILLSCPITEVIQNSLYNFPGLIHRTQFVDIIDSVTYINDSKSTSPDATIKALTSIGTQKNVILISGGNDKDISYDSMSNVWMDFVHGLILLPGSANDKLKNLASRTQVKVLAEVTTMSEAMDIAVENAPELSVVLLSPATDSHASFKSFEDRGNQFIEYVRDMKTS